MRSLAPLVVAFALLTACGSGPQPERGSSKDQRAARSCALVGTEGQPVCERGSARDSFKENASTICDERTSCRSLPYVGGNDVLSCPTPARLTLNENSCDASNSPPEVPVVDAPGS